MIDFDKVPSPCFVLEEKKLMDNLAVIDRVRRQAGVEVIVALKACAMWSIFPTLAEHSDGATASSVAEARLVFEEYGSKAHTYAPVYTDSEFGDIIKYSSHVTFNSLTQWERFGAKALLEGISCGLRVNPGYSTVRTELYNPASPDSRLGIPASDLPELPDGVEGIHFHTLCESRPRDLRETLDALENGFGHLLVKAKWLNMGGGHLITEAGYDEQELITILNDFKMRYPNLRIIMEPGSAFTWQTGYLVSTVEDIVRNGGVNTAMLDVSFACHMPDTLEMPYKPGIVGAHDPEEGDIRWRMGGNCCLAGDYKGDWAFDKEPSIGGRIVFEDMIHYTMVKTTMFNGVSHPAIAIWKKNDKLQMIREFGYEDFKNRMS